MFKQITLRTDNNKKQYKQKDPKSLHQSQYERDTNAHYGNNVK